MEKKNNNILLTIIGIATLLVALVGATFAFFTASNTSAEQEVQAGVLNISTVLEDAPQANIMPTDWDATTITNNLGSGDEDKNPDIAKFTFTVNGNDTNVNDAKYDITLVGLVTPGTAAELGGTEADVQYKLLDESNEVVAEGDFSTTKTGLSIKTGVDIAGGEEHVYTLCVWIEENTQNQDNLQGKDISAQLIATAYTTKPANS